MPVAAVGQANINYEIIGSDGPWVALVPGGRRDLKGVRQRKVLAGHFPAIV